MKKNNLYVLLTLFVSLFVFSNCSATSTNSTTSNEVNKNANKTTAEKTNVTANKEKTAAANSEKTSEKVDFAGFWDSEKLNVKGNKWTQVSLNIKQNGDKISGIYSVVDYIGDEPQVEDGNQNPFIGTIKDGTATIKFDPENVQPGYEENVEYKEPADGKAPATATLTMSGKDLQVNVTSGEFAERVPKKITFKKTK